MNNKDIIPSERTFWLWMFTRLYKVKTFMYWYNSGMTLESAWRRGRAQTWKGYQQLRTALDFEKQLKALQGYSDWLSYLEERRGW